jgi:alpha-L-rhamnosidase
MKLQSFSRIFLMTAFSLHGYLFMDSSELLAGSPQPPAEACSVSRLRCEHMINPAGIGTTVPRFSWVITSAERNQEQSACQILVASSPEFLTEKKADFWNSGKVKSGRSILVDYGGEPLSSRDVCWWKVRIWDRNGKASPWSEPARFEIGLLSQDDWEAAWIRPAIAFKEYSHPAPLLRRDFSLQKEIRSARLYVSGLGLYRASLNGKEAGDLVLTPGWTSYTHRIQYQTYDVTKLLKNGANAIGIMLGNGWYRAFSPNNLDDPKDPRNALAARAQLEITFKDGSRKVIPTDNSWKSSTGAVLFSEIYDGEIYDARLEKPGWDQPGYDDSGWSGCLAFDPQKGIMISPASPPMRRMEEIKPIAVLVTPQGDTVIDMGQNMVGRVRLRVDCPPGTRIELRHAEVLDREGNFYTDNLRKAAQKLVYTCRGGGVETYEPLFTFQGFRYVAVSGYPGRVEKDMITGIVIHSDLEQAGSFSCNNSLINQLQHNIVWGQKGNFLDVPTDCPQRDERLGWTGDAEVFAPTACFNMDCAGFYTKWLADLAADQEKDGRVPSVIPAVLADGGASGWADAAVIVPWTVYRQYGDVRILENQYPSMKAWVEFMRAQAGDAYLWTQVEWHFGDWLAFATTRSDYPGATTDKDLLANAYFYHSTNLLLRTAEILGYDREAEDYRALMGKIKAAFGKEYLTPNGRLSSNTQTAYVVALSFGLIPEELELNSAARLAADVDRFGHLTTGFLGTPDLCRVLTRYGYLDEAYMLLYRKRYPSWLYPVTQGATTIWERWDGLKPDGTFQDPGMNSFNHYAYGAVGDWLYREVAGINMDPDVPGYKKIIILPHPGNGAGDGPGDGMNDVKASHESPYGTVSSAWKTVDGNFILELSIPVNTTAEVFVPSTGDVLLEGGKEIPGAVKVEFPGLDYHFLKITTGSGKYTFTSTFLP